MKLDFEGQGQSPPKTIETLTKVFCNYGSSFMILAWTGHGLSCGQACDWHMDGLTDTQKQATTIPEGQNWPWVKNQKCQWQQQLCYRSTSQIAKFMGPTWGPPGSCQPLIGPTFALWTLLSVLAAVTVLWWLHRVQLIWRSGTHRWDAES